jgi:diguanylate cyclase (GGDEF)-like protein
MQYFSWIDNRTLLLCQCILIAVFSAMMLGLRSLYPGLRGITSIAGGFVLGIPATLLLISVGRTPTVIAAVGGGSCVFLSSIFLYNGILHFCRGRGLTAGQGLPQGRENPKSPANRLVLLCVASGIALAVLVYFSTGQMRVAPCVVAITATLALARGLMAWSLVRCANGRRQVLFFGVSMGIFALLTWAHSVSALANPPADFMQRGTTETLSLLTSVVFLCVQGVFYLLLFAGDVAESVHEQACLDHLSGTLNRRGIENALTGEIARVQRAKGAFSVLLIDLDEFKGINDRYGHAAGDDALRTVAQSISSTVRVYDRLGRFGGDEFLLLLPQAMGDEALLTADRIRDALRDTVRTSAGNAEPMSLTVSIGVTCCTSPETMKDILLRADAALYRAKREGKDCARLQLDSPDQEHAAAVGDLHRMMSLPGEPGTV